jgi:hypothetical protein
MSVVNIFKSESVILSLNKDTNIFNFDLIEDNPYDEKGFEECIEYFRNAWVYIKDNNLKFHLLINLGVSKKDNELPLHAYIKLIKMTTELNDIFIKHCHSVCILTEGSEKWQNSYNLITKLWNPPDKRPFKFTDNPNEVNAFFLSNKIQPPSLLT